VFEQGDGIIQVELHLSVPWPMESMPDIVARPGLALVTRLPASGMDEDRLITLVV
jgi:hypothetical protein